MKRLWPFRHFGLKVLSFATAVLLWMVVSGDEIVERGLRVPVELQQLPAGLELAGDIPTTLDVRVRGGSTTLSRVSPADVVAVLDLRSARPGRRLFPMTQDQMKVPFGVDVVQITPSAIALIFEASATRQVPVAPAVDGHPAPGYVVDAMSAAPSVVDVVGPESAVKHVTEAVTEPVSIGGASAPVRELVRLGLVDPMLRLKNARAATVTVQIAPAPLERTFRDRPVHLRQVAPNLTAKAAPSAVNITLRGTRDELARIEPDDVVVYVDVGGLGAGQYQLNIHANPVGDAGVIRVDPSTAQVWIASVK